jgi:type VI secretion system protein ImpJ
MFIRSHHFQAAQRYAAHLVRTDEKWDHHHNWGLRAVELDLEALANYRFVVHSLKARLRDGTLVSLPEDGALPEVDLKPVFERDSAVKVFLAVPVVRLGRANVAGTRAPEGARYVVEEQELEDENTGTNPQPLLVRLLNSKLLLSTQDPAGYEVVPLAALKKSSRAEAVPQLDDTYIPPVIACDAWKPLWIDLLQAVYHRVGAVKERHVGQVVSRGISFESQAAGDRLIMEQLRALNEAAALLNSLAFTPGIHPLPAYLELCRLVGQLAIFGKKIGPGIPDLPRYDHDDLGGCFYAVRRYIEALLDDFGKAEYLEEPFIGEGLRMQVRLTRDWLEPAWQMYVGVQTPLSMDECVNLLRGAGGLDMKIGSAGRVEHIFKLAFHGLAFTPVPNPPRALPARQGLIYFQVDRRSQQDEWDFVQKELTLAIRLNEHRIAGNIQGKRVLTINLPRGQTSLEFTLYLLPQGS